MFEPAVDRWACVYGLAENCLYAAGAAQPPPVAALDRKHVEVGTVAVVRAAAAPAGVGLPAPLGADAMGAAEAQAESMLCVGCRVLPSAVANQRVSIVHPETCEGMALDGCASRVERPHCRQAVAALLLGHE